MKAHIKTAPFIRALKAIRGMALALHGKSRSYPQPLAAVRVMAEEGGVRLVHDSQYVDMRLSLLVPAEVEDAENGEAVGFSFDDALRLLRRAPREIILETAPQGDRLRFVFAFGHFTLPKVGSEYLGEDFHKPSRSGGRGPCGGCGPCGGLETEALAGILERVLPYAADEDYDALSCVRVKPGPYAAAVAEALNGHQYANAKAQAPYLAASLPARGLLIRRKVVPPLAALLRGGFLGQDVGMRVRWAALCARDAEGNPRRGKRRPVAMTFSGETGAVSLNLPDYRFPETDSFLGKARASDVCMTVAAGPLFQALDMIAPLFNDAYRVLYWDLDPEGVTLRADGMYKARMRLEAEYTGAPMRTAFPASPIRNIVARYKKADSLRFAFTGTEGPCLITAPESDAEVVIMPMKIVEEQRINDSEVPA